MIERYMPSAWYQYKKASNRLPLAQLTAIVHAVHTPIAKEALQVMKKVDFPAPILPSIIKLLCS